ncbi:hypothetical protein [Mycolicibacterium mucogenicum]|uniref:Head-to-tail adaptor n=1 Tax=Mycolicibacterium mucogenicum DSM 44124 TaxID=1226753 RepID=A0A8H2PFM1_MYCMU|nr:hypothetical protein [Mycolicibacterium mucogenicum]KAB7761181.1 hypothetical protein MMUC44124_00870 [Mycolicibacterium mucogenicum DSM 44124]QPG69987.1 hypothetical protein C1S78_002865 [Mycolicibacterium mucogenicum DSM 44124]
MSCDWPIDRTCLPELPVLGDNPTPSEQAEYDAKLLQRNAAEDLAVEVLYALSGRQFGVCPEIIRPCPPRWWDQQHYQRPAFYGMLSDLDLYVLAQGCGCAGRCIKSGPRMLHLPGPVVSITKVTVDGAELAATDYQLEQDTLYRLGDQAWPGQNLGRPLGEPGTWSVEYQRGTPPPRGTANLVGMLAKEFLAACNGGKCRLPRNVTHVSKGGVSYEVYNPNDIYSKGKTGIPEVDLWLSSVNPNHLAAPPSVI